MAEMGLETQRIFAEMALAPLIVRMGPNHCLSLEIMTIDLKLSMYSFGPMY